MTLVFLLFLTFFAGVEIIKRESAHKKIEDGQVLVYLYNPEFSDMPSALETCFETAVSAKKTLFMNENDRAAYGLRKCMETCMRSRKSEAECRTMKLDKIMKTQSSN